ncbi:MAG TPA: OsmC family protein [Pseudomonadales bacterium]|nr:OsmC family protein [Pseudomonadales bacterium]
MLMKEKATAVLENENYLTRVTHRNHEYFTDEPTEFGGQDKYTTPQELLLGSLASCVATTLRMYANRKGWDLGTICVDVTMRSIKTDHGAEFEFNQNFSFSRSANLTIEQLNRLVEIAKKCPVAQIIQKTTKIAYVLGEEH